MKHNPFLSFLLAILLALLSWGLPAQDCPPERYQRMMREANTAVQNGQYDLAINKLQSAKTCQPDSEAVVNLRVLEVFKEVNRQRELAIKNEREAKKQTKIAQTEREKAEAEARRIYANDLAFKSQIALREGDRTTAFRLAEMAGRYVEEGNPNVMQALMNALYYNDHPDSTHRLPWALSLEGHVSQLTSIAFSPDGKRLATGTQSTAMRSLNRAKNGIAVKIWDVKTGNTLLTINGFTSDINSIAFSPNGNFLATASKTAKIWDSDSGIEITEILTPDVSGVAFSPDGETIATSSKDGMVKIWNVASGKETTSFLGHTSYISTIVFSPDGKYLATGGYDSMAKIWDLEQKKDIISIKVERGGFFTTIAFSPDGKRIATGSNASTVKVWDVMSGKETAMFITQNSGISSVAFSPDGKRLATGSWDGTSKIWDVETTESLITLRNAYYVSGVAFSPDGKSLAIGSWDGTAKIWDIEMNKEATTFGHAYAVNCISFSPDGKRLAAGLGGRYEENNVVKIWPIPTIEGISFQDTITLRGYQTPILSVSFSPNGYLLATGSNDPEVKIWNVKSGKESFSIRHEHANSVAFSPIGDLLATGSTNKTIEVWDLQKSKKLRCFSHQDYVSSVAFSPDGKQLASGSGDNTVKIWDIKNGEESVLFNQKEYVGNIAFSPDGKRLAAQYGYKTARIWDLKTGKSIATLQGHTNLINGFAFSPDGTQLATGSGDQTAKIWSVENPNDVVTFSGHAAPVLDVRFSPDGKQLATGSWDGTAKIWELTPEGWRATPQGQNRRLAALTSTQLQAYSLESLLYIHPDNEQKLLATREVWQIKAFADLATAKADGGDILARVEPSFARADRLYAAALALQDEELIRQDYAHMLRRWAEACRGNGQESKAKKLEQKAQAMRIEEEGGF
jgi:WD40 repeat protein